MNFQVVDQLHQSGSLYARNTNLKFAPSSLNSTDVSGSNESSMDEMQPLDTITENRPPSNASTVLRGSPESPAFRLHRSHQYPFGNGLEGNSSSEDTSVELDTDLTEGRTSSTDEYVLPDQSMGPNKDIDLQKLGEMYKHIHTIIRICSDMDDLRVLLVDAERIYQGLRAEGRRIFYLPKK